MALTVAGTRAPYCASLRAARTLAAKLQASAGNCWPVEETSGPEWDSSSYNAQVLAQRLYASARFFPSRSDTIRAISGRKIKPGIPTGGGDAGHFSSSDGSIIPAIPSRCRAIRHPVFLGTRPSPPDHTSTLRCFDRLLCGAGKRAPTSHPCLRPAEQIRGPESNRPWRFGRVD